SIEATNLRGSCGSCGSNGRAGSVRLSGSSRTMRLVRLNWACGSIGRAAQLSVRRSCGIRHAAHAAHAAHAVARGSPLLSARHSSTRAACRRPLTDRLTPSRRRSQRAQCRHVSPPPRRAAQLPVRRSRRACDQHAPFGQIHLNRTLCPRVMESPTDMRLAAGPLPRRRAPGRSRAHRDLESAVWDVQTPSRRASAGAGAGPGSPLLPALPLELPPSPPASPAPALRHVPSPAEPEPEPTTPTTPTGDAGAPGAPGSAEGVSAATVRSREYAVAFPTSPTPTRKRAKAQ
ncbi:uncharacterized protein V1510DRAFT_433774, partial [Dipodascopsis tothii]|uniref:uncharacterized protein n=1 Tax=Dipodascopsis tothii TaxID=44089 RepID=UPI0034CD5A23